MSIDAIRANNPALVAPTATSFKASSDRQPGASGLPQSIRTENPFPTGEARGASDTDISRNATPTEIQVSDAVEKLSKFVASIRPEISFSVDQSSGTRVVKIMDSQSKEVLRQIPSEEAIQLAQALDKLQGLFVRDKA